MTQTTQQSTWGNQMFQKFMVYFEKESVRTAVQTKIIDPILSHILKQVFPYILLICIMFVLLLFSVLITLGVILFQRPLVISAATAAALNSPLILSE